jgi:hypothetical protein
MMADIRHIYDSVLDMQNVLYRTYSSAFDNHSAIYAREVCLSPNYFYEALEFNVSIAGNYSFWGHSGIETYGYLYRDDFNPSSSLDNLVADGLNSYDYEWFYLYHPLMPNITYILVVTSIKGGKTGNFSVVSSGPAIMQFAALG